LPFRVALRSLSRSPGVLATAVVLLALGIGATTAVFSVVNTVLLSPLPYKEPDRLVRMWTEFSLRDVPQIPESVSGLQQYRSQATLFEDIGGVATSDATLALDGRHPVRVQVAQSTWNMPKILGISPALGRVFDAVDGAFSATDVLPGAPGPAAALAQPRVVMISHALWRSEFGERADVVGQSIEVNGNAVEIIGVLPRGFRIHMGAEAAIAPDVDLWWAIRPNEAAPPGGRFLRMVGRLKPGVTVAQAQAEMSAISERIYAEAPNLVTVGARIWVASYVDDMVGDVRGALWALLGAAGLVLLIACANVANLLLIRAAGRVRELAVASALGARRSTIVRQLLAEAAVLAGAGALSGILVAYGALAIVVANAPANIARLDAAAIDPVVLAFAVLISVAVTLAAGLAPALHASRVSAADALRSRSGDALQGGNRLRWGLVAGEVALSFVLLVGAGLMARSFVELNRTDLGFDPQNVVTFQVSLPFSRYPTFDERKQFLYTFQERIAALPGVESVGAGTPLPLSGLQFQGGYSLEAPQDEQTTTSAEGVHYRVVMPGYFETMRTPLVAGRLSTMDDDVLGRRVVVIDNLLAARFPDGDAVGKQIWFNFANANPQPVAHEVIGVVQRQVQDAPHAVPRGAVYMLPGTAGVVAPNSWVVRSGIAAEKLIPLVREELGALDPALPVATVRTMQSYVDEVAARTGFALQLLGAFGLVALAIAAVGLYAAIHFVVRQRRAEIGVRMSCGARQGQIFALFMRQGLMLAAVGIGVGGAAAFALAHTVSAFLYNVTPTDPLTYMAVGGVFALVVLAASSLPALAAARTSPMMVLREE
jgi:predicted permease